MTIVEVAGAGIFHREGSWIGVFPLEPLRQGRTARRGLQRWVIGI